MKSFALGYKSRNNVKNLDKVKINIAEVHINLWKVQVGTFWPKTSFFFG